MVEPVFFQEWKWGSQPRFDFHLESRDFERKKWVEVHLRTHYDLHVSASSYRHKLVERAMFYKKTVLLQRCLIGVVHLEQMMLDLG